ncbi:MAG: single-stranded DNA-binding protein [Verrucomicrobiales bacterium]|nr:single-stranded DNA-binding protein [Verrucomicrobiales bacterium]|tara:strand:- start:81721 stop:82098 length:378 start_codon:yes stop_codon:yes gene_type:complete
MLNRYNAMGNLTRDPEIVDVSDQHKVCKFSIAINNPIKKTVLYMDVEAWNRTAENCQKYLTKGSAVAVDGRLDSKKWTTDSGQNRSKIFCVADNVHFVRLKNQDEEQPAGTANAGKEEEEEEVPF